MLINKRNTIRIVIRQLIVLISTECW